MGECSPPGLHRRFCKHLVHCGTKEVRSALKDLPEQIFKNSAARPIKEKAAGELRTPSEVETRAVSAEAESERKNHWHVSLFPFSRLCIFTKRVPSAKAPGHRDTHGHVLGIAGTRP